jgi:hypothetical protein
MAVDSAFFTSNDPTWVRPIRETAASGGRIPVPNATPIEPDAGNDVPASVPAAPALSWPRIYPGL